MILVAPVDSAAEAAPLIEAGANELYFGFGGEEWISRYAYLFPSGQRFEAAAMLHTMKEVRRLRKTCAERGARLLLALNGESFVWTDYPLLRPMLDEMISIGLDAVIVADMGFLSYVASMGMDTPLHYSSVGACLNSEAISFLADLRVVNRVILPQHLTLREIAALKQVARIDLEAFAFDEKCFYLAGFCGWLHGVYRDGEEVPNACRLPYSTRPSEPAGATEERTEAMRTYFERLRAHVYCGLCAVWDLDRMGVTHLKISGRGKPTSEKIKHVTLVRELIAKATETERKADFVDFAMRVHQERLGKPCGRRCYYGKP